MESEVIIDEETRPQGMGSIHPPVIPNIPNLRFPTEVASQPFARILEQPAPRSLRFRYECEGRSAGSIVGANSTPENRTYPTIQVVNYQGPAAIVVSCVTKEGPPYRPHPHNLVGREGCKRGICSLIINNPEMTCSFTSLGIQCVKRKDVEKSLKIREFYKVDPFGTGFNHRAQAGSIDLNIVRLCFQVFLKGPDNGYSEPLPSIVSDLIYDKKAMSDLTIMKLSHYSAPASGGTEVILLCDKVAKDDIQVWFYEEHGNRVVWEMQAEFQPSDVHKQVAIAFRVPRYCNENIQQPAPVFVELRRPSDNVRGDPRPFQFLPVERDSLRKRPKIEGNCVTRYLEDAYLGSAMISGHHIPIAVPRTLGQPSRARVKVEPLSDICGIPSGIDKIVAVSTSSPPSASDQFTGASTSVALPLMTSIAASCFSVARSSSAIQTHSVISKNLVIPGLMTPAVVDMGDGSSVSVNQTVLSTGQNIHGDASGHVTHMQQATPVSTSIAIDDTILKFDSLGLDIDPNDFNVSLPTTLSTSLFDSANNIEPTLTHTTQEDRDTSMPSEESLNRISRIQNELVELSKLCKNAEST